MTKPKRSTWRDVLPIHRAALMMPPYTEEELHALGDDIKERGLVTHITIFRKDRDNYSLLDGINRLDAMEMAGIKFEFQLSKIGHVVIRSPELNLDADVARCREVSHDPYGFVVAANIHRRHLTAEKKRELIAEMMKACPEKSDRQIAETIKTSPSTVGKVRKELEQTGDVSKLDTRTDTKGRKQAAHKPTPPSPTNQKNPKIIAAADRAVARSEENQAKQAMMMTTSGAVASAAPEANAATFAAEPEVAAFLERCTDFAMMIDEEAERLSEVRRSQFLIILRDVITALLGGAVPVETDPSGDLPDLPRRTVP